MTLDEAYTNSILEQNYVNYLKKDSIKIISFDIFDTLFFRKCGSSDEIFTLVGEEEILESLFNESINFRNYRINCEKEAYKLNKISEEIVLEDIYNLLPIKSEFKNKILEIELEIEKQNLFINNHIFRWIKLAKEYNKKVILTSDMYLSKEQIKYIALDKIDEIFLIDEIFVSSELGIRKSSGKLFEFILNKYNIKAIELLHIGDNISSDVNVPEGMGINSIYYNYKKSFQDILFNEKLYLKEYFIEKDHLRLLSYLSNPYSNDEEAFFYQMGSSFLGPVLWEFSIWLHQLSEEQNIKQFNFFLREGFTFEKFFKMLFPDFSTNTVSISRESTNFLTLNLRDLGEVNFNTFREFRIKDFYDIYFLDILDNDIKKFENKLFNKIDDIKIGENIFLKDYILNDIMNRLDEIKNEISNQEKGLEKYLKSLNIDNKSTFIDFGGGGTVFNRINNKFFKFNIEKLDILFYMHKEGFKKALNNRIIPFLPYNEKTLKAVETIRRTPDFFEILLNGYNHTTNKYKINQNNVEIVEKKSIFFDQKLKNNLDSFCHGIEVFFTSAISYNDKKSLYNRNYITLLLARIIAIPSNKEVAFLGNLNYDEGRGSNNIYPLINKDIKEDINLKSLYLDYLNNPFKSQYKFPWLEGYITSKSPNLVKEFYGINQSQNDKAIDDILKQIDEKNIKEIYIYAAGELFELLLPYLKERSIRIKGVIDSRAKLKPFNFLGYDVVRFDEVTLEENDVIVIASVVYYDDIKKDISTTTTLNII